jgi:hypothetical protein
MMNFNNRAKKLTSTLQGMAVRSCTVLLCSIVSLVPAIPQSGQTATAATGVAPTATHDGSHDFDFIFGKWRMPNHKLKTKLAGAHDWADFVTCDEGQPLPGGIGNTDFWTANYWKDFVGVTVRTYDPATGLWRIYWVDNKFSKGKIQPPVVGKFDGDVGIFEGPDTFNGIPILVRYTWKINPKGSEVVATWNQAFSTDHGKTWETNWYNEFIHDDSCTPTTAP